MYKLKLIIVCFLFISTSHLIAQDTEKTNNDLKEEFKELLVKLEGTYQIQILETRVEPSISFDLLKEIDRKRLEKETIFIHKEHYSIEVPSFEEINSEDFKPLEKVIYS